MTIQTTLEQLAEKLGGKIWEKGDVRRIYLNNAGDNTKKMTTKTYVFQKEDGTFGVSCYIECPSQPFSWIKSQQEQVISRVMDKIAEATANEYFYVTDANGVVLDDNNRPSEIKDLYIGGGLYLHHSEAEHFVKVENTSHVICTISKADYEATQD